MLEIGTVDFLAVHDVLKELQNTPFEPCDSLPHAKKIGDDIRDQVVEVTLGKRGNLEGNFGHHFCTIQPYSCAHRIGGTYAGFDPEIQRIEDAGLVVPADIKEANDRYRDRVSRRDYLAHGIEGLGRKESERPEHTEVAKECNTLGTSLRQKLIELCREACQP
jgi:hypothetical protein